MVTDAQWADIDNDGRKELILAGDWMPVEILKYINHQLKIIKTIDNSNGWWNCITVADINNDGKPDIIAGNLGLNSRIKPDSRHPAKCMWRILQTMVNRFVFRFIISLMAKHILIF